MRLNAADRSTLSTAGVVFAFTAMILALAALFTAAHASTKADAANKQAHKASTGGAVPQSSTTVTEQEFAILLGSPVVKSGKVTLTIKNVGTMTHELVIVRAQSPSSLPRVTKKGGERAVGSVDEEAIPESEKVGEAGDVPAGTTTKKTFDLAPGSYVLFCNIDTPLPSGPPLNHFSRGMRATLVAV